MVSGIDSNFFDLGSIQHDLQMLDTNSSGEIATNQKEDLSKDLNYFLDNLGDETDVDLTLQEVEKMMEANALNEPQMASDMDLDLDLDVSEIPDSKSFR